jgi:hypothetical protein
VTLRPNSIFPCSNRNFNDEVSAFLHLSRFVLTAD